jgi:polysaccharide chain length determinant protein (PEP-CTERM system associated)
MRELYDLICAHLRGAWRFRWLAMAAAWLLCISGWLFVFMMPDSYESEATVLIDTTSDLDTILDKLTIEKDELSRLEIVRTIMLGTQQLEKTARETDLHLRANPGSGMDGLIAGLRSRISITSNVRSGANIYRIKFRDSDPQMSHAVVSTLLNNFVEETLGATRAGTKRAQDFLRGEITSLEKDLTAAEERLANFKRENVGRMPGEGSDYFGRIDIEMSELERTQAELRQAVRRRDSLRNQLAGEQPAVDGGGPKSELDTRIADNQRKLEELQLRFTELHPDVIAVKATLDQLRAQKQEQVEELLDSGLVGVASDNPVFQSIQIELAKVSSDIASLEEERSLRQNKLTELRDLVDVLPRIEAELARLNRDYDVKQAQYRSLLQRLEVAELSESVEQSEDVKFQIVNPPLVPVDPAAPNRPMLLAMVLMLALGAGGAVAFLGDQLKPVFTDPKTIRTITGLPVLGTVGILDTAHRRRRRVAQIGAFGATLATLGALFVVVFLFQAPWGQFMRSLT